MTDMNPRIRLQVRNAVCTQCRLSGHTEDGDDICVTGIGSADARIMIVSKSMGGKAYLEQLADSLLSVGINFTECFHTAAVKCRVWDVEPSPRDVKSCRSYLDREIEAVKPGWILALGNEALLALTGHSGIMSYRGKTFDHASGAKVFATISPAMVIRNPRMAAGFAGDMAYFANMTRGKLKEAAPIPVRHAVTLQLLKEMDASIPEGVAAISWDVESTGFNEWEQDSRLVSISFSALMPDGEIVNWAVPLYHPQSGFRKDWVKVLRFVCRIIRRAKKIIAHNGKFDLRWVRQFAPEEASFALTFDTMLAAHLLDETGTKGLKPLAQQ